MPRLKVPDQMPDVLVPGIRPDAVIMRNGMGESIFVPRSRYEDFERFLRSESQLPSENTVDTLEQMQVAVQVDNSVAKLTIDAQANIAEPNGRWLSIPIGLGLVQIVPSKLSGAVVAEFPPVRVSVDGPGYVWRVSPGPAGNRNLHFEGLSNLRTSPQGQSLRLDLPNTPTVVRIALPIGQWELNAIGNGTEVVEAFEDVGATSIANVRTKGGGITLVWAKKSVAAQIQAIEVESMTKYVPQLDSLGFRATASVAIRGPKALGGKRFLFSLPAGSQWRAPLAAPDSFPGYRFGRSESDDSNQVMLLEFEETFSRTEIELPMEWQTSNLIDSKSPNSDAFSFPMVRVEGTQRHIGNIDVVVPRNVSFRWEPQPGIQFVRQSLLNDGSETLAYTFRFNQQNEPLVGRWNSGEIATDLKAMYSIVCDPSGMRLSGSIEMFGDVRLLPFLQLDVRGWTVERVQFQPSGKDLDLAAIQSRSPQAVPGSTQYTTSIPLSLGELLDANSSKSGSSPPNRLPPDSSTMPLESGSMPPLLNAQDENSRSASRGISFVLYRPLDRKLGVHGQKMPIAFSLPMLSWLDAESQQRLALCVGGDMTINSAWLKLEESAKLPEAFTPIGESIWKPSDPTLPGALQSVGQPSKLGYRVAVSNSWLDWTGSSESMGATIQANAEAVLVLDKEGFDFTQTWTLSSNGGVAESLRIGVSKDWLDDEPSLNSVSVDSNRLQLSVDGVSITAKSLRNEDGFQNSTSPLERDLSWLQIELPDIKVPAQSKQVRILQLRKRRNHLEKLSSSPSAFSWLLPTIAADKTDDTVSISEYSGRIVANDGVICLLESTFGDVDSEIAGSVGAPKVITFQRNQLEPRLSGSLRLPTVADRGACDIESVWLQTIVNAVEKRDRFVFRIKTKGNSVSMSLPADRIASAEILVNGKKASMSVDSNSAHRVDISLAPSAPEATQSTERIFVVEVFLWSTNNSQWLKSLQAECPSVMNCKSRAPLVWQIVVPTTVHLIGNSSTLSPGYQWRWQELWFGRTSDLNQETIASQIGATSQRFVSEQTNQYVFFSLDHTIAMKAWTAPRTLLWAPVALFVLVGSFLVMEFKWVRKPWVGISLLLASLAFSQWLFDLSVALSQCFVVAIVVAALYATLKWVVDRRARRRSVFVSRPSSPMISVAARNPSQSGSAVLPSPKVAISTSVSIHAVDDSPPSTTISSEADGVK